MKSYQNQLDRFRDIAKKLVDEHSAELFTGGRLVSDSRGHVVNDAYFNHLDTLGKQLDEHAQTFIGGARTGNEALKSEIWSTCKKYLDQFVKRNQPGH
jgi:hypothetical protein